MKKNVIEVTNLEKYYEVSGGFFSRKKDIVKAVDDISFGCSFVASLCLVGQSCCSTTTTSRVLCLFDPNSRGDVTFYNTATYHTEYIDNLEDLELTKFTRSIQMILQDPS